MTLVVSFLAAIKNNDSVSVCFSWFQHDLRTSNPKENMTISGIFFPRATVVITCISFSGQNFKVRWQMKCYLGNQCRHLLYRLLLLYWRTIQRIESDFRLVLFWINDSLPFTFLVGTKPQKSMVTTCKLGGE